MAVDPMRHDPRALALADASKDAPGGVCSASNLSGRQPLLNTFMLAKILSIENIGRFVNAKWRSGYQFENLTVVYGENGRGKSTFCDLLRSNSFAQPDILLGRRTLGTTAQSKVEVLLHDKSKPAFDGTAWTANIPNVAIFDLSFVHQNVYAGDRIDHDHKRNLHRVIVGQAGVTLARRVEELDRGGREAGKDATTKRQLLMNLLPAGTDLKAFLKLPADAEIQTRLAAKTEEIQQAEVAARRAADITSKPQLGTSTLPVFPNEAKELLTKNLSNVAEEAEKTLRAHVSGHTLGATNSWISQGIAFIKGAECPFCGQGISGSVLISAYRAFFDESYKQFKAKLQECDQSISRMFGEQAGIALQKVIGSNEAAAMFWKDLGIGKDLVFPDLSGVADTVSKVKTEASALLVKKIAAPLESIADTTALDSAHDELEKARSLLTDYNKRVKEFNDQVAAFKAKQTTVDVSRLKQELAQLSLIELRHSTRVVAAIAEDEAADQAKKKLEKEKTEAKQKLDNHGATVFGVHEKRINELLDRFAAEYRIGGSEGSYVGGRPSSTYKLMINGQAVDLGDERTAASTPSFKNTLSAGDRSTLALALFVSQLERDPNLKDMVVVLDDPFTSQDASRRTATQSLICELVTKVKQVILLSHDPKFLRVVWDEYRGAGKKTAFQFARMGGSTIVGDWDIEHETRAEYVVNHRKLYDFAYVTPLPPAKPLTKDELRDVARVIRIVLEGNLRIRLPHSFKDNEWLGNFIDKIRNATATEPAFDAQVILPELEAINTFSKKYHHDSNPAAATEHVDETELLGYVRRTLKVVGGF